MNKNVRAVIDQINNLPTLPQVVTRVIQLSENPDTSASDIARVISSDQALMTKVLKVVNSAYFGLPRKISTLTQATVILGFNTVKNLAITASVLKMFGAGGGEERFKREDFWRHSLGCAAGARVLAKQCRFLSPEEAFVAGLIHDIGKIVIDQLLHEEFERILDLVHQKHIPIIDAEKQILGVTHADIGQWLGTKWNFPNHLVDSIAYHHRPEVVQDNHRLVRIVRLADLIARRENLGSGGDQYVPDLKPEDLNILKIPGDSFNDIVKEIKDEYERGAVFLTLL